MRLADYAQALTYYLRSKKIKEELGDKNNLAAEYNNIGSTLLVLNNYTKARENFEAALEISLELHDKHSCAICYTNLGQMYLEESSLPNTSDDHKRLLLILAKENFHSALSVSLETQQKNILAMCYANIGHLNYAQANYPNTDLKELEASIKESLAGHIAALELWKEIGDRTTLANAHQNIGVVLMECEQYKEAQKELTTAEEMAKETSQMGVLKSTLLNLTYLFKANGDFEKALQYQERYCEVMSKMMSEEQQRQITLLSFQHNMDMKDKNARLLDQKKREIELYVKKLERSNDELRQFANVAAHDLQAPLRMIRSYLDILKEDLGTSISDIQVQYISTAINGSKRMSALIYDLLRLAKIDVDPLLETISILEVVDEVKLNLYTQITERNAQVVSGHLPAIKADRIQLVQLFQNLISNGIKYNESPEPLITIQCELSSSSIVIKVSDNAIGIKPEYREVVFHIFRRLHTVRHSEGTGIGLSLCKKIVEGMGGKINIEDNPKGGSVFVITLPSSLEG